MYIACIWHTVGLSCDYYWPCESPVRIQHAYPCLLLGKKSVKIMVFHIHVLSDMFLIEQVP